MQIAFRADGTFNLIGPHGAIQGLAVGVEVGQEGSRRWLISRDGWWDDPAAGTRPPGSASRTLSFPGGSGVDVSLAAEPTPEGTLLRITVTNRRVVPLTVQRIFPLMLGRDSSLALPAGARPVGVYKQGWQSWSYSGWRPLGGWDLFPKSPLTRAAHADPTWPPPAGPGRFQSEGMLMVGAPGAPAVLLAGFTAGRRMLGRLEAESGGAETLRELCAFCEADGVSLGPGESLAAEPLLVALGPEAQVLEAYAAACAWEMEARAPERSPAVWCSWYYHLAKVREEDVVAAARGLRGVPIDVIQLDDGYQRAVGDWLETNRKFPHGLVWLAEQIRQQGFTPGLWLAPFIATRRSRLFQENPEWFVRSEQGQPAVAGWNPAWKDVYAALDTTHPRVREWLTDLVKTLVEAGFKYLKLDFLHGACAPGERFDRTACRAQALRLGLETIRRAAGEDVFLLGCGSPMLPAVGVVDAMRVGPDVAPSWGFKFLGLPVLAREPGTPSARNALQGAVGRQWMHGRLWANDPDSAILRDKESELTADEARTLISVAALSGGVFSLSDPPQALSPERAAWLRRAVPPAPGFGFQPLTYLAEPVPFLATARCGEWLAVLAVNASDSPRPLRLAWADLGLPAGSPQHVYDAWSGEVLGIHHGIMEAGSVPPHGSRVLTLRPVGGGPEVVGTTYHLVPSAAVTGAHWDGQGLSVTLAETATGRATVTVWTAGRTVTRVAAEGARVTRETYGPADTYTLELATEKGGAFQIGFA